MATSSAEATPAKPFLKWVGGKRQLLPVLEKNFPEGLGDTVTRYAEPFLGGGATLFHVLSTHDIREVWVGDMNESLIATYRQVQENPDALMEHLADLENRYRAANVDERQQLFLQVREQYNTLDRFDGKNQLVAAALFMMLNRTAFNGLYRVNSKGQFNVPHGKYSNPSFFSEENIKAASRTLQNVTIHHGPYTDCEKWLDENTFLYADPPYRPLNTSSSFASYTSSGFNDEAQERLAAFLKKQHDKGVKVMMSNSDPKNTDEGDDFFDDLYAWGAVRRVDARRSVNSVSSKRGPVKEILFTSYNV